MEYPVDYELIEVVFKGETEPVVARFRLKHIAYDGKPGLTCHSRFRDFNDVQSWKTVENQEMEIE